MKRSPTPHNQTQVRYSSLSALGSIDKISLRQLRIAAGVMGNGLRRFHASVPKGHSP
jgi:hypothetical protein